jgi:hypothetical protein
LAIEFLICGFLGVSEGVGEGLFLRNVLPLATDVRLGRLRGDGEGEEYGEEEEEDGSVEIDIGCLGRGIGLDASMTSLFRALLCVPFWMFVLGS